MSRCPFTLIFAGRTFSRATPLVLLPALILPAGLDRAMEPQVLADLVAYLKNLQ